MDGAVYVLIIVSVGLVTFGLVLLLFAEIFKGWREEESNPVKHSKESHYSLTEEERFSLTPQPASGDFLSRLSGLFHVGTSPARGIPAMRDDSRGSSPRSPRSGMQE